MLDPCSNAIVRGAATKITGHGVIDVGVGRIWVSLQQRSRGHDLPGLAVAALRDIKFAPRLLERMQMFTILGKTLDRRDLHPRRRRDWRQAGSSGNAVEMDRARAALPDPATEFRSNELEIVAQNPKQRRIGGHVHASGLPVYVQGEFTHGKV